MEYVLGSQSPTLPLEIVDIIKNVTSLISLIFGSFIHIFDEVYHLSMSTFHELHVFHCSFHDTIETLARRIFL